MKMRIIASYNIIKLLMIGILCSECYAFGIDNKEVSNKEYADNILNIAFPQDILGSYPIHILIRHMPSLNSVESQIIVVERPLDKQARIIYRKAGIPLRQVYSRSLSEEKLAELMKIKQKEYLVSPDVVNKWIEDYWSHIDSALDEIRQRNPYEVMTDADIYHVELYINQNKISFEIASSVKGNTELDIKAIREWLAPIQKYVDDLSLRNE